MRSSQIEPRKHPTVAPPPAPREGRERLALWGFLIVVLVVVAGLGVWSLLTQQPITQLMRGQGAPVLPVYGMVPDFTLVERSGRPVRLEDLHGKVWIASFIFTHCPDECPLMTAELARLQSDFAEVSDLRLVSITVDPDRDTPAVLSQYAAQFHADPERWLFLTGDKRVIYQLAREGFRLGISAPTEGPQGGLGRGATVGSAASSDHARRSLAQGVAAEGANSLLDWLQGLAPTQAWADHGRAGDIGHSTRFVLIDRQGHIRGYYDSLDGAGLQRLRRHIQSLLRET